MSTTEGFLPVDYIALSEDLTSLSDADLRAFDANALTTFNAIGASGATEFATLQAETATMGQINTDRARIKAELSSRADAVNKLNADRQAAFSASQEFAALPETPAIVPTPQAAPAPQACSSRQAQRLAGRRPGAGSEAGRTTA
jgi:hypothetical protein